MAVNEEVLEEATQELGIDKSSLSPVTTAEVGNTFKFGSEKSEAMGIYFTDEAGQQKPIYLASYGIGITRVMGVIVEKFADERGIVWPDAVAPYRVYLARLGDEPEVVKEADALYEKLQSDGISVLYDDSDKRPGEKFADADLLGIPHRVVVSSRTVATENYEYKGRSQTEAKHISYEELKKALTLTS